MYGRIIAATVLLFQLTSVSEAGGKRVDAPLHLSGKVVSNMNMEAKREVIFEKLPQTASEVSPGQDPYLVAAYAVAALIRYQDSREDCFAMLDVLRGPRPLSNMDKQFLRDRLVGKEYVPVSYFAGAVPANNYQPSMPYSVTSFKNKYSESNKGYLVLYIRSGGADSPRPVTLRQKESTGEWFVWTHESLLPDIRKPASQDPWS